MADNDDLFGAHLSRLAGILEEASAVAASGEALRGTDVIDRLKRDLKTARSIVGAVEALQRS